jgi:phospholipid/cholesterol/gamma-HCH transport system substrate-binding protein
MIGRRVRVQLLVFVLLTAIGVGYAGVRYVGWGSSGYTVRADFAEAGGIFEGAAVTYRGVTVGRVGTLDPTKNGVHLELELDKGTEIPASTLAVVANRSAVGEQYVDLQPRRQGGPYLAEGATIPRKDTRTPLPTTTLLLDVDKLVESVPKEDLVTVLDELGQAFSGTGTDLSRLVDNGNLLIRSANDNLDETVGLIEDSQTVLETQRDSGDSIKSFASDLAGLSDTLVESDQDLRTVLDQGVATAEQVQGLVEENRSDLPVLLGNMLTTGQIVEARLEGVQHILILYPHVLVGSFAVIDKDPLTGHYTSHFGLQLSLSPGSCREGYESTKQRPPEDTKPRAANDKAGCEDEDTTMRGSQFAPKPEKEKDLPRSPLSPDSDTPQTPAPYETGSGSSTSSKKAPSPADETAEQYGATGYDPATGKIRLPDGTVAEIGSLGGQYGAFGEDSWKWLLIGPLTE